jgi:hypothetical protein
MISSAKNKKMVVAAFSIYLNFNKIPKMYFLIAGCTSIKEEQAKQDIEGIATVFRNAMFGMAFVLLLDFLQQNGLKIQ